MGLITKYGTQWGAIPQTAGRIFWVAPSDGYTVEGRSYRASDGNDGLSPERALRRPNRAANLVSADVGDIVVLLPGTHTCQDLSGTAESLAMDVAGVHWMGLPGGRGNYKRQKTVMAAVTGDQIANVTAANIEISYLHWIPVTADSAIDLTDAADNVHIHNCSFDMETPAVSSGTIGIDFISGASDVLIEDCFFVSDAAHGPAIVAGACLGIEVRNCVFHCSASTWVSAMTQAAAGRELLVRGCQWTAGNGVITNGCLGTGTGEVGMAIFWQNFAAISVTKMVDGYDSIDAELAENYQAEIGDGTAAGTLVLVVT